MNETLCVNLHELAQFYGKGCDVMAFLDFCVGGMNYCQATSALTHFDEADVWRTQLEVSQAHHRHLMPVSLTDTDTQLQQSTPN